MKKALLALTTIGLLVTPQLAQSADEAQQLGTCLTDSLNGKERKDLAKWIYLGMSTHSTIRPYANISQDDIESSSKYVGGLITRLLTQDCPKQAQAALDAGGTQAFEFAFGIVGEVAMLELMSEPSVSDTLGLFEQYMDQEQFNKAFK